jgi:putative spermidine/putrescine transport system permease protein
MTRSLAIALAVLVLIFLVAPLAAIVPISLTSGTVLSLPIPGLSLRWYEAFFTSDRWMLATRNSIIVGGATALLATILGTLAATGLWLGRPRPWVLALLSAPLLVPSVIAGLAMYFAAAAVGLSGSFAGLVLAHTVLALPYVIVTVMAALQGFDRSLLRAAASLGAPPALVLWRIAVPLVGPAIGAGALFAFATSFDELIVALFIAGPGQYTLPRQMLAGMREYLSPTICAAAVILSGVSVLLLGLGQAAGGRK